MMLPLRLTGPLERTVLLSQQAFGSNLNVLIFFWISWIKNFETSLPNEEWVYRRLAEGSRPSSILKRFLPHFTYRYFHLFSYDPFFSKILIFLSFFFLFRLYETYFKEQVRWSEVVDRKKTLLAY